MNSSKIFIAGSRRPLWQTLIASGVFTVGIYILGRAIYYGIGVENTFEVISYGLKNFIYISALAISFTTTKGVYVDIANSKFKNTWEIGPIKIGEWKEIPSPEYVSVFQQLLSNGEYCFEVNLWYDTNKHWELFDTFDSSEAFLIGFDLSEQLGIDVLDATTPNDYKWIDKEAWREKLSETT